MIQEVLHSKLASLAMLHIDPAVMWYSPCLFGDLWRGILHLLTKSARAAVILACISHGLSDAAVPMLVAALHKVYRFRHAICLSWLPATYCVDLMSEFLEVACCPLGRYTVGLADQSLQSDNSGVMLQP
jgi:hypothetical protein